MSKIRPTEWEQLIADYNHDNQYIKSQKRHWLPPKGNMKQKQFGAESPDDGAVDQAVTKKNKPSNNNPIDPDAVLPKKKGAGGKKATLSPVMQIMKAVTASAINPPKKKAPAVLGGPSKANLKTPQDKGRITKGDGPSAEKSGKA